MTTPTDAAEGQRVRPARNAVLPTWQEYLTQHPNGGGYFNDWLLRSMEALVAENAELQRRVQALETAQREQEGE